MIRKYAPLPQLGNDEIARIANRILSRSKLRNGCMEIGNPILGYPIVSIRHRRMTSVGRFFCHYLMGMPNTPLHVACHACDNHSCCNPRHLAAGTTSDNGKDMARKSRSAYKMRFPPVAGSHTVLPEHFYEAKDVHAWIRSSLDAA